MLQKPTYELFHTVCLRILNFDILSETDFDNSILGSVIHIHVLLVGMVISVFVFVRVHTVFFFLRVHTALEMV